MIKDKDRFIARMILGLGLSLTIASAIPCATIHSKFSDVKDEYWNAVDNKNAYLDAYEQSDEFKTAYNADVEALKERLIAREIDGNTYDVECEKLNDNAYTEQVLLKNASLKTKKEFNDINQKVLDIDDEFSNLALSSALTAQTAIALPLITLANYGVWETKKKTEEDVQDNSGNRLTSKPKYKHAPYYDANSGTIRNADDAQAQRFIPHYDEKYGVIRMYDTEDIQQQIEEQESENML